MKYLGWIAFALLLLAGLLIWFVFNLQFDP